MSNQVYKTSIAQETVWDSIIIGSGIGGLANAALLAKAGKKVLVLERHYIAGGFTHTFRRKAYEWDVGVHYIGEVHRKNSVLRRVFDYLTDSQLEWAPMGEVYDKVVIGDRVYDFVAGVENFRDKLTSYFPAEKKAIDTYLQMVFETSRAARNFFMERALPPMVAPFARPFLCKNFLKYSDQTTWDVVSNLTKNKELIGVLTAQYGDYGLPPRKSSFAIHAVIAKHYLEGGSYPIGGSGRMAETIIPIIEAAGGRVLIKADVKEILIKNNKAVGVKLANGDEILAATVVSDAGVTNTFGSLVPEETAEKFSLRKKSQKISPSLAHICLYLGFKGTAKDLGFPKWNYWIYPDADHDEAIRRYETDPSQPLPVTYISFPSAKDPDWDRRNPGTATMEAVGFAPYDWFQKWEDKPWQKRGDDYNDLKQKLAERLLENIYRFIPQIKGKIDYQEISTPLSTKHFANYQKGEIYGLDHTPERFRLKWLRPHTPIKNLYLTGQDIVTDGIGGALMGGVLTASVMLKKNLVKEIMNESLSLRGV